MCNPVSDPKSFHGPMEKSFARLAGVGLLALAATAPALAQHTADRLYGTVITTRGDRYEGLLRWDKNEASWVDVLDGTKRLEGGKDERASRVEIFGISFEMGDGGARTRTSGIRFGHLRALEPEGSDRAVLFLRTGERVVFTGGSTDIGTELRELLVETAEGRLVELGWRDIERVEFAPAPRQVRSTQGERLYGTVETSAGDAFTGFVTWDVDEVLTADLLDGDDERNRRQRIPFGEIRRIEQDGNGALVTLTDGRTLRLDGTNDVDGRNNDLLVLDPGLGQIRIDWDDFEAATFSAAPYALDLRDFTGAGLLYGTVTTRDGEQLQGTVRWDDDEAAGWEFLNGERDGIEFEIEMGQIEEIERLSSSAAFVTLRDGRTIELRGSNDVNSGNEGIVVTLADGREYRVDWSDFDRVVFEK